MTTALHTDFKVYPEEVQAGFNETLIQETDAFNAASNGAILMSTNVHEGYYHSEAFFKAMASLVTRRDLTSTSGATELNLTEDEMIRIKLFRKIGPVHNTRGMFRSIMRDPGEFSVLVGQQAAKATAIDMLNSCLRAAVAALQGTAVTDLVHNVTAASPTDTISSDNLIQTLGKAGDSANDIVVWVMHSTAYYKLVRDQMANTQIDAVAGVNIATGTAVTFGRPVIITDSTVLFGNTSPTDPVRVLGLRRGAVQAINSELEDMVIDDVTGNEQLSIRVQGEFSYDLGVMGFKWDTATVPNNPTDTQVGTAGNWDLAATNVKSCAGVLMIADPT